jgi:hypothetical protein
MLVDSPVDETQSLTLREDMPEESGNPLREKIQDLQKISNVVQALENLIAQCDGLETFEQVKLLAVHELIQARRAMAREICLLSRP